MSSSRTALVMQVEQLRREANVNRITVSEAIKELVGYVNKTSDSDVLLVGVSPSDNPFKNPQKCTIL